MLAAMCAHWQVLSPFPGRSFHPLYTPVKSFLTSFCLIVLCALSAGEAGVVCVSAVASYLECLFHPPQVPLYVEADDFRLAQLIGES